MSAAPSMVVLALVGLAGARGESMPRTLHETALLTPPGPTNSITFGSVVAFAGDHAVVSGPILGRLGLDEGQIVSFRREGNEWVPTGAAASLRGIEPGEVALQTLASMPTRLATVRKSLREGRSEIAVFEPTEDRRSWSLRQRLRAPQSATRPHIDGALAARGDILLASNADTGFPAIADTEWFQPQVFVFAAEQGSMRHVATLDAPEGRRARWFGASLAFDGERAAIGSPRTVIGDASEQADDAGPGTLHVGQPASVMIHRRDPNGWRLESEVLGRTVTPSPGFGATVAIESDLLAVRATDDGEPGASSRVFVFRRIDGGWTPEGELLPDRAMPSAAFGAALAVSGTRILVGDSHSTTEDGEPTGLVHCFERFEGRWIESTRLVPRAPAMLRSFGSQIAVHGDLVLVNRTRSSERSCDFGGAYLFQLPPRREMAPPSAPPGDPAPDGP